MIELLLALAVSLSSLGGMIVQRENAAEAQRRADAANVAQWEDVR